MLCLGESLSPALALANLWGDLQDILSGLSLPSIYKDDANGSPCFKAFLVEESRVMPTKSWWALRQLAVGGHFSIRGCREPGKEGRSQTVKCYVSAFKRKLSDKSDKKMTCCKK